MTTAAAPLRRAHMPIDLRKQPQGLELLLPYQGIGQRVPDGDPRPACPQQTPVRGRSAGNRSWAA
ncbi:MAG: hypothetical protein ACR2MP_15270 [Streptosporangiaceae bacterium]